MVESLSGSTWIFGFLSSGGWEEEASMQLLANGGRVKAFITPASMAINLVCSVFG